MLNGLIRNIEHSKIPIKRSEKNARRNGEYKRWRKAVYKRDCYRCRVCGRSGYLNAHHILGFKKWKSKRYLVENGFTMCKKCHYKFHKKYGKSNFPNIKDLLLEGRLDI